MFLWVGKVATETYNLIISIRNLRFWFVVVPATRIEFFRPFQLKTNFIIN